MPTFPSVQFKNSSVGLRAEWGSDRRPLEDIAGTVLTVTIDALLLRTHVVAGPLVRVLRVDAVSPSFQIAVPKHSSAPAAVVHPSKKETAHGRGLSGGSRGAGYWSSGLCSFMAPK